MKLRHVHLGLPIMSEFVICFLSFVLTVWDNTRNLTHLLRDRRRNRNKEEIGIINIENFGFCSNGKHPQVSYHHHIYM